MNFFRTFLLLAALTALFMAIGFAIGGTNGMLIAFFIAAAMNVFTYWNADKLVLSQQGAQPVDEASAPELYRIVRKLAADAGLPMPAVYIFESEQPNAFATGRDPDHAAVAASTGLLNTLDEHEVAGVLAHELAHIKNRDTLIMTVAATIAGAISMLANFGLLFGGRSREEGGGGGVISTILAVIVAPIAAALIQMAISRSREYAADRLGGKISGHPLWLASALGKIEGYARQIPNEQAEENPAMAHLFIINPLTGAGMDNLFSTHPNTENRIAALEELAREMGQTGSSGPSRISQPAAFRRAEDDQSPFGDGAGHSSPRGPWE